MERVRYGFAAVLALAALLVCASAAQAAFPGQNGKIAYVHSGDIWTVDPDGTDAAQLTSGPASDAEPNWSPDGKQIAFSSNRDSGSQAYVMDAGRYGRAPPHDGRARILAVVVPGRRPHRI